MIKVLNKDIDEQKLYRQKCVRIFVFKPVFCKYIEIYLGFESLFSFFTLNENLCGKNASLSKIAFFWKRFHQTKNNPKEPIHTLYVK